MPDLLIGPLVRAISPTSIVIWAEVTDAEMVTLLVQPTSTGESEDTIKIVKQPTACVGQHHYVTLTMDRLKPATWYSYQLISTASRQELHLAPMQDTEAEIPLYQYFRTLAADDTELPSELRLAYGSCRKAEDGQMDTFNALGTWLHEHVEQRETDWPHLLLLIGDQIYADEPPRNLIKIQPQLTGGAKTFEDFALCYRYAWTHESGVRQVLAALPTYMIFDDHEITNNWNSMPTWRTEAIQAGKEQLLIDGLLAYWLYQGWGNLDQRTTQHPLLTIMQTAAQSGEDAIEALRACLRDDLYGRTLLRWHYQIPTNPSIFVSNTRTERTTIVTQEAADLYAPTRIMHHTQVSDLQKWFTADTHKPAILVSSVPVLLPPAIGYIEYLMGQRPFVKSNGPLRWLGWQLARLQLYISIRASFDHWPLYPLSWQALRQLFGSRQRDLVILSGDVHFSYALQAHSTATTSNQHLLYQFVSTPLQNVLRPKDQRMLKLQAHITQLRFGGLLHQILPFAPLTQNIRVERNLLFENTIAMVTLQSNAQGHITPQQEYWGCSQGRFQMLGKTILT